MLLLGVMLLICSLSQMVRAEEAVSAASSEASAPCKGLKPYNNLDELLYQFYINLESDCLFEMPIDELEEAWGIKILSSGLIFDSNFYYKPYKSEKDAFYVSISNRGGGMIDFKINITKDYYDKFATLFPDGNFPKLLPEPIGEKVTRSLLHSCKGKVPKSTGVYGIYKSYYWGKKGVDHVNLILLNNSCHAVLSIMVLRAKLTGSAT